MASCTGVDEEEDLGIFSPSFPESWSSRGDRLSDLFLPWSEPRDAMFEIGAAFVPIGLIDESSFSFSGVFLFLPCTDSKGAMQLVSSLELILSPHLCDIPLPG